MRSEWNANSLDMETQFLKANDKNVARYYFEYIDFLL